MKGVKYSVSLFAFPFPSNEKIYIKECDTVKSLFVFSVKVCKKCQMLTNKDYTGFAFT